MALKWHPGGRTLIVADCWEVEPLVPTTSFVSDPGALSAVDEIAASASAASMSVTTVAIPDAAGFTATWRVTNLDDPLPGPRSASSSGRVSGSGGEGEHFGQHSHDADADADADDDENAPQLPPHARRSNAKATSYDTNPIVTASAAAIARTVEKWRSNQRVSSSSAKSASASTAAAAAAASAVSAAAAPTRGHLFAAASAPGAADGTNIVDTGATSLRNRVAAMLVASQAATATSEFRSHET